jgi:hypothetical protein
MAINFHKKIRVKNISNLEPEQASEYHGNHGRHYGHNGRHRGGHHKGHHRHH